MIMLASTFSRCRLDKTKYVNQVLNKRLFFSIAVVEKSSQPMPMTTQISVRMLAK